MTDINQGYFSHTVTQGSETFSVAIPVSQGMDAFKKRIAELRASIPEPRGADPDALRQNVQKAADVEIGEFDAHSLVKNITDGKVYWKVKGHDGKFPKFPVTIWPEVIERDLCSMDKLTKDTYPLDGYKAQFEKNEKGNPKKIVALAKG